MLETPEIKDEVLVWRGLAEKVLDSAGKPVVIHSAPRQLRSNKRPHQASELRHNNIGETADKLGTVFA